MNHSLLSIAHTHNRNACNNTDDFAAACTATGTKLSLLQRAGGDTGAILVLSLLVQSTPCYRVATNVTQNHASLSRLREPSALPRATTCAGETPDPDLHPARSPVPVFWLWIPRALREEFCSFLLRYAQCQTWPSNDVPYSGLPDLLISTAWRS